LKQYAYFDSRTYTYSRHNVFRSKLIMWKIENFFTLKPEENHGYISQQKDLYKPVETGRFKYFNRSGPAPVLSGRTDYHSAMWSVRNYESQIWISIFIQRCQSQFSKKWNHWKWSSFRYRHSMFTNFLI
jgi:hypothetical protein